METVVCSQPDRQSEPVSDVVIGNLLKPVGRADGWLRVELPDGRAGYLEAVAAEDDRTWRSRRRATPENIAATARRFLGRPYLWGGNSPKGLDCSGFTQLVFGLNGIGLPHKASEQAARGTLVPFDRGFGQLRMGDLVFFGRPNTPGQSERVTHVGIFLEGGLVIHSAERVQVNRLEAMVGPTAGPGRRTLLRVRRLLE
jgi:cell wall-associated NlpC family hydrolase